MVHDAGALGLRAIFERAGMPQRLYPVFRSAIDMVHEMDYDDGHLDQERFSRRMIERVLTKLQGLPKEELDYLLDRLNVLSDATRNTLPKAA